MNFERLNELMKERKISQRKVERDSGLAVGSITKWKVSKPNVENLKRVADVLGVSSAYLMGESDFRSEQDAIIAKWKKDQTNIPSTRIEAGVKIPVLGSVHCGIPFDAIENVEDWEEISEKLSRTGVFFGLFAKGDSMSPRINEGDVLIVRQQEDCDSGNVVIVKIGDNEAYCKKIIKNENGIVLQSFNPIYPPEFYSNEEIQNIPVKIIGRVIENRQKM